MVGANAWYIMAEDYWYIVVRGVTRHGYSQSGLMRKMVDGVLSHIIVIGSNLVYIVIESKYPYRA